MNRARCRRLAPTRQFAMTWQLGRFGSEADIQRAALQLDYEYAPLKATPGAATATGARAAARGAQMARKDPIPPDLLIRQFPSPSSLAARKRNARASSTGSGGASTPLYLGGGGLGTAIISWIFNTPPSRTFTPPQLPSIFIAPFWP